MSSKVNGTFVACVVGLSLERKEYYGVRPGIGKSCLCHRFAQPGYDNYISTHQSLYALHEFESQVVNNDHFLYWGSLVKDFPSTDPSRDIRLMVHTVEHTVCYQDVTCQPFTIINKPDDVDKYIKRIIGPLESPGKLSYESRDDIAFPDTANIQEYPARMSSIPRGFLVVIDVSQEGEVFRKQLVRAEKILDYLSKHKRKNVIVASKRDCSVQSSLERVYVLKKKYRTHVVETSAENNLNVQECFRLLAQKLFKDKIKNLSSQVQTYQEAAHSSLIDKGSAQQLFVSFLKKRIQSSDAELCIVQESEDYKKCVQVIGKFNTDKKFSSHLLEVYNSEIDSYSGVKENPDMRLDFLEEYLERRTDLSLYEKDLKLLVDSLMSEISSSSDTSSPDCLSPDNLLDPGHQHLEDSYHIFQKPNSPVQSSLTLDSGFNQDGATLCSQTSTEEENQHETSSYYSNSSGEEGPDYVNFDPNRSSFQLMASNEIGNILPVKWSKVTNTATKTEHLSENYTDSVTDQSQADPTWSKEMNTAAETQHPSENYPDKVTDRSQAKCLPPPPKPKPKPLKLDNKHLSSDMPSKGQERPLVSSSGPDSENIKSRALELQAMLHGSGKDVSAVRKAPPPAVPCRGDSLSDKSSTESESDASLSPCTPRGTRKSSRVAPPPPQHIIPSNQPKLPRNYQKEFVLLPSLPLKQDPASDCSDQQQVECASTSPKRTLDTIRERLNRKKELPEDAITQEDQTSLARSLSQKPTVTTPTNKLLFHTLVDDVTSPPSLPERENNMNIIQQCSPLAAMPTVRKVTSPFLPIRDNNVNALSTDEEYPPLPPRTPGMLDIADTKPTVEQTPTSSVIESLPHPDKSGKSIEKFKPSECETKSKKQRGKDYITKSVFKKKNTPSEGSQDLDIKPKPVLSTSPNVAIEKAKSFQSSTPQKPVRNTFLNMMVRPLPAVPFSYDKDESDLGVDHEYESFDFDNVQHGQGRAMLRLPEVPKTGSSSLRKSESFSGASHQEKNPNSVPRPLMTVLPAGVWPDYIEGYVNTEPPPLLFDGDKGKRPTPSQSMLSRPLPLTPFQTQNIGQQNDGELDLDYDYPNVQRLFHTLSGKSHLPPRSSPSASVNVAQSQAADSLRKVSLSSQTHKGLVQTDFSSVDEYIPMGGAECHEQYANSATIDMTHRQFSQQPHISSTLPRSTRNEQSNRTPQIAPSKLQEKRALDDSVLVYMNFPDPTLSLPPRHLKLVDKSDKVQSTIGQRSLDLATPPVLQYSTDSEVPRLAPPVSPKPSSNDRPRATANILDSIVPSKPMTRNHSPLVNPQYPSHGDGTNQGFESRAQSLDEYHTDETPFYVNTTSSVPSSVGFLNDEFSPPVPVRRESRKVTGANRSNIKLPPRNIQRNNY